MASNALVRSRASGILWRAYIEEARRAEEAVRAGKEATTPQKLMTADAVAGLHSAVAAELSRVHNAYCAGIVAEVIPPYSGGEASVSRFEDNEFRVEPFDDQSNIISQAAKDLGARLAEIHEQYQVVVIVCTPHFNEEEQVDGTICEVAAYPREIEAGMVLHAVEMARDSIIDVYNEQQG